MEKKLLDTTRYNGQYDALKSPDDDTVVGSGETPSDALEQARQQGCLQPVLVHVPTEENVHIF